VLFCLFSNLKDEHYDNKETEFKMYSWKRTELGKDFRTSHLYEIKIDCKLFVISANDPSQKQNNIFRNLH
jgi:hypothetical protein